MRLIGPRKISIFSALDRTMFLRWKKRSNQSVESKRRRTASNFRPTQFTENESDEEAYQGVRVKFTALLGRARVPLQVDIGFGDAVTPRPEIAKFPTLLDFPAPNLRVYPKETVMAEKFEAMVSRMPDCLRRRNRYLAALPLRASVFDLPGRK